MSEVVEASASSELVCSGGVAASREIGQVCPCIGDPVGSTIVEILQREGGDVERGSNLGNISSCLRLLNFL